MEKLLATLLEEFHADLSDFDGNLVTRQLEFPRISNKIMVAIGMRRTGKTYFLFQKIQNLIAEKIPLESILYINFEDDRLIATKLTNAYNVPNWGYGSVPLGHYDNTKTIDANNLIPTTTLQRLLDAFYSSYPENHDRKTYLFLDEIQNVAEWSTVIRRFFDKKNTQIFLTGSSAKLLSKEIASSLRGRSIATEIWPYSFSEYLNANKLSLPKRPMGQRAFDNLKKQFLSYMETGGFPETIGLTTMDRNRLLREYIDVVIFRDIIERHKITNIVLIKYLIRTLINNAGRTIAINKLFNDLKSQGFQVGKATLYDYLAYIEDAFLAFTVPLYADSIRKTQVNPRKVYIIDSGVYHTYALNPSSNNGHLLENLVYLDLRRRGYDIYYYLTKSGYEVDFFAKGIDGSQLLLQVAWDTEDGTTQKRELRALQEAEQELGIKGQLITVATYLEKFI